MRLASVGRTALNRGSRNLPRCTISFFFFERVTRLSETLRSAALCFCSLRVSQTVNFILPFNTFKTHSLIQLTNSLLHFEMIALRNFVSADFCTCSVIIRLPSLHRLNTNRRRGVVLSPVLCGKEISDRRSYFVSDPRGGSRRVPLSRPSKRYIDPNYLRGTLDPPGI